MSIVDYFFAKRPLVGNKDNECGDVCVIQEFGHKIFLGIVDVLGHGQRAHEIAIICKDYLEKNCKSGLVEIIEGLHEHIMGTRGATVGLSLLDIETGELRYSGMGNTVARIFRADTLRIVPRPGVVGYEMRTPMAQTFQLNDGDVLVMCTDGIMEHFELADYPELLKDSAETIVNNIMQKFSKEKDDAACITLKYHR